MTVVAYLMVFQIFNQGGSIMGKRVTKTHNKNGTVTTRTTYTRKTLSGKTKSETFVKTSKDKGCYVATAVYGSYDCPEVWTLRRYRDSYLMKKSLGRLFVKVYYAVSPKFIAVFGNTDWFNRFFKVRLDRFVKILHKKGYSELPYTDK